MVVQKLCCWARILPQNPTLSRLGIRHTTAIHFRLCSSVVKMKVLNVAEKNDAAKSLADLMSNGRYRRREGFSKFNKIYEFDYELLRQNCTMVMTSVSGHLLNYEFVGQYKRWNGCNAVTLFDAPVQKTCLDDYKDIKRTLEREVRGCQTLVVWTDGDREGENIGFEIIQVCRAIKPNIRVYRARFSEITPGAIRRACDNLVEPDQNQSDAVDVRSELDLRIGASFTRFQTQRLQKVFPTVLADQLISYGSCQFPTLGFVVERYKEIQNFIAENFWKIKVTHQTDEGRVDFNWKRNRLFEHTACLVLYQHCLETPLATVIDVDTKSKNKWRPVALDTVELEKIASRKLRITAKEIMRIAEKLYTSGYISYPRTETNKFPPDLDLAPLVANQTCDPNWGGFASRLLQDGPNPRNGTKSDQAHPPIHPIKYADNLQGNEARVYEFIVRHFLACCSKDARGCETVVEIDIAQELFSANGLMILERNYLEVYPYETWNAKTIPVFTVGSQFNPTSIEMNQSETVPPNLLTEADLIALMDKHGIGTDATHADHIETIKSRMYVGLQADGKLVPGELGMGLCDGYDAMGYELSKPNLRAGLEADLKLICEGRRDKNVVLREQIATYKAVFIEACKQAEKLDVALSEYFGAATAPPAAEEVQMPEEVMKCNQCGNNMVLRTKKDGKGYFVSCIAYPECKHAIWLPEYVLQATVSNEICDQCQPGPTRKINFTFKRGSVPPMIPTQYTGCVGGCDYDLNDALDLKIHRPGASQAPPKPQNRSHNDSGYSSTYNSTQARVQTPATTWPGAATSQPHRGGLQFRDPTGNQTPHERGNSSRGVGAGQRRGGGVGPTRGGGAGHQSSRGLHHHTAPGNTQPNVQQSAPSGGDDANNIVCSCGHDARLFTVRKEGPNQGRQFYKCSNAQGCNFFLWADRGDNGDTAANSDGSNNGNTRRPFDRIPAPASHFDAGGNAANDDEVQCNCPQAAKFLTVQKDGPNRGRQFYACPKPQGQGCNFFMWADDTENEPRAGPSTARGRGAIWRGGGRGRGGDSGRGGGSGRGGPQHFGRKNNDGSAIGVKKRKCGVCGQEGHNRKSCPQS